MTKPTAPYHAHVYFDEGSLSVAQRLHRDLEGMLEMDLLPGLILVGKMHQQGVGPHPEPQFEVQFLASALARIVPLFKASGLTSLVHPVTDDDLADHTTLAQWIGEPLPLDKSVLDPPGHNKGLARFGKVDF
ncbi:MAG TPA: DOPA 4,5-dioxygenase family protein [Rhodanobacteraceae bacterium]|nr:DOPA 4,5-dioxygenase family protein [Rhodanobacteraceae bacterium]